MSTTKNAAENRTQVFAIWKHTSKEGKAYFTGYLGKDKEAKVLGFFNTKKKNPKEPDLRIYKVDSEGKAEKEVYLSMWCNVSKRGTKYLTAKQEGKRVIGFINNNAESKAPYVSAYIDDQKTPTVYKSDKKQEKTDYKEIEANEELPF